MGIQPPLDAMNAYLWIGMERRSLAAAMVPETDRNSPW